MSDIYNSISSRGEGLYKDQGSRFIAFAIPVETEEEVKELVAGFRKEYHDARHHCYAYRIDAQGEIWRASDDGEPSGTAGRPILGQIDSAGLSDILVVVVRYFGGIKLGVPGNRRRLVQGGLRLRIDATGDEDGQGPGPAATRQGVRAGMQHGTQGAPQS